MKLWEVEASMREARRRYLQARNAEEEAAANEEFERRWDAVPVYLQWEWLAAHESTTEKMAVERSCANSRSRGSRAK